MISGELRGEAEAFRLIASHDFPGALSQFSTPDILVNFVAGGCEVETVLYQHPWADALLLTAWSREADGRLRINDIGIVMGSVARGATDLSPSRSGGAGWQRPPMRPKPWGARTL